MQNKPEHPRRPYPIRRPSVRSRMLRRRVLEGLAVGMAPRVLAALHGLTTRRVEQIRAEHREHRPPTQGAGAGQGEAGAGSHGRSKILRGAGLPFFTNHPEAEAA